MASNTEGWLCVRYISPSYCEIKRGLCHYFCSPYFFFWSHAFKLFLLELGDPNTCLSQIYCDCAKRQTSRIHIGFVAQPVTLLVRVCNCKSSASKVNMLKYLGIWSTHFICDLKLLPSIIFPTLVFQSDLKKKKNPWSSERLKCFLHSDKIQEVRREER